MSERKPPAVPGEWCRGDGFAYVRACLSEGMCPHHRSPLVPVRLRAWGDHPDRAGYCPACDAAWWVWDPPSGNPGYCYSTHYGTVLARQAGEGVQEA